jgi:hypothetical protein
MRTVIRTAIIITTIMIIIMIMITRIITTITRRKFPLPLVGRGRGGSREVMR